MDFAVVNQIGGKHIIIVNYTKATNHHWINGVETDRGLLPKHNAKSGSNYLITNKHKQNNQIENIHPGNGRKGILLTQIFPS